MLRFAPIVALLAPLGGCDAPIDDADLEPRAVPVALHAEADPDPRRCEAISAEASELIDGAMVCADHVDCEVEPGTLVSEEPCLPQLACWLAVSTAERVELDVVLDRLQALDREYRDACGTCAVPMCVDPDLVYASCERSGCVLGTASPPVDGGSLAIAPPR